MRQRKLFLFATVVAISVLAAAIQAQTGIKAISVSKIRHHLEFLASDEMRGRNTPSPELDSCAAYIAREFARYGLRPVGDDGTYLQHYNLLKTHLARPNTFLLIQQSGEREFHLKSDFVPLHLTANRRVKAPVVFAGYGITAPKLGYDDYRGIDVAGKIVLIFTHEPQEHDSSSVFDGVKPTGYSKVVTKAINAREHGAVGMILVTDPNNHRFRRPPNPWPSLMRKALKNAVPLTLEEKMENKLVAVRIGKSLAEALVAPSGKTLSDLQTKIDDDLHPQSFQIPGITVAMETHLDFTRLPTQNVVGLLEGEDPDLKDEVIVIGAHYDHLGVQKDTIIFHGADDNASGTVGVITLAEALATQPHPPKRSILFCTWSGEEKGLFGSRYYVDSAPIVPLEKTVVNLNLDMIGRLDSSKLYIDDLHSSPEFSQTLDEANKEIGLRILEKSDGRGGSDHMSFKRKNIPVLGFFTGFHPDYHRPTDTADKCNLEGIAQICRLVFNVAWRLAEASHRPAFSSGK